MFSASFPSIYEFMSVKLDRFLFTNSYQTGNSSDEKPVMMSFPFSSVKTADECI